MTIVETTVSSDPSEISGTRSAEATTVRIQGNRAETRSRRDASRSIAYTGLDSSMRPVLHERGEERPVTAAEVGERERPGGSERASSAGTRSTSKWIAVSVYRSLTRARLRAVRPAVARLALATAHLEPAARALERRRAATPCALRSACRSRRLAARARRPRVNLRTRRGRLRFGAPGAVAERLGRGLQSLVQRFESARRLIARSLLATPLSVGWPPTSQAHRASTSGDAVSADEQRDVGEDTGRARVVRPIAERLGHHHEHQQHRQHG